MVSNTRRGCVHDAPHETGHPLWLGFSKKKADTEKDPLQSPGLWGDEADKQTKYFEAPVHAPYGDILPLRLLAVLIRKLPRIWVQETSCGAHRARPAGRQGCQGVAHRLIAAGERPPL